MPSYAVIGASRGIGYAFLQHLSKDPQNVVVGTARSTGPTIDKVNSDGLKNVTIIAADLTDRKSLQGAAAEVSKLTGGSLDYLILNGAWVHEGNSHRFLDDFEKDPEALDQDLTMAWQTNVVGMIDAINAFVPLVKKGSAKKVVGISSGMADLDLMAKYDIWEDAVYSISKVALNAVMAKYAARYGRTEGILFLSLAPGLVDVGAARTLRLPTRCCSC
jgi:NAD(P)-dependent dehydrogenase (short-subunit alcohol dehydrogenase family)